MTINDSGIAVSVINVVRKFRRNKNRTIATKIAPSRKASSTLLIELSIKFACRKSFVLISISSGRVFCSSLTASSTFSVNGSVSPFGDFCTDIITAGCPFAPPSPRLIFAPKEVAEYGEINRDTLARYVELPDRMPTHDTYNRLFGVLDTAAFNSWFENFSKTIVEYLKSKNIEGEEQENHLALDGKTICNSGLDRPFHILHAWCVQHKLLLMQKTVDQKTNEITAMPVVLEMLDIKGAVISIDAMGAQREICKLIIDKEGDYVVGLKENQPSLYEDVQDHFKMLSGMDYVSFSHCDKGHGRF